MWLPIETAPKDGRIILSFDGTRLIFVSWHDGNWHAKDELKMIGFFPIRQTLKLWMPAPNLPTSEEVLAITEDYTKKSKLLDELVAEGQEIEALLAERKAQRS